MKKENLQKKYLKNFWGSLLYEHCMSVMREIDQKQDQTVCRSDALKKLIPAIIQMQVLKYYTQG
jgi:hypothetical protein